MTKSKEALTALRGATHIVDTLGNPVTPEASTADALWWPALNHFPGPGKDYESFNKLLYEEGVDAADEIAFEVYDDE